MTHNTADFAGFYDEWSPKVYNYARHRTGSATRADEIVADTFTRVLKSWSRFDPQRGDRRTWLFAIAVRAVCDHYRWETRRSWFGLRALAEPVDPKPGPERSLEAAQEQRGLMEALSALPSAHREVVSLKFFSGMTNRAIAEVLGLSVSNVGIILFRSVRRMRKSLPVVEADHE